MDYLQFMGLVYLMLTDTQRPLVASFVVLHINTVDHEASTVLDQNVCIPGRYELTFFKHFFNFLIIVRFLANFCCFVQQLKVNLPPFVVLVIGQLDLPCDNSFLCSWMLTVQPSWVVSTT